MFKYLFDLRYERDIEDAFVFYFCYVVFAFFIAGLLNSHIDTLPGLYDIGPFLVLLVPFIFYTSLSIGIFYQKNLKDKGSIYLLLSTIALTLLIPVGLGFCAVNFYRIKGGFEGAFMIWFFPALLLGCIPVTFLTGKEDNSLLKQVRKLEREDLHQEIDIKRRRLIKRVISKNADEISDNQNNDGSHQ